MGFDEFMVRVGDAVDALVGCGTDDLPDFDYASSFENRVSPRATAAAALDAAGWY